MTKRYRLWTANSLGMAAIVIAAILHPVVMLSAPCDANCDPHGYVAIFSVLPAGGVVVMAMIALALLGARKRLGFGVALVAALACAGLLVMFGVFLTPAARWPIAAVTLAVVGLAIAGLRWAPARVPRRLDEPPYPSVG